MTSGLFTPRQRGCGIVALVVVITLAACSPSAQSPGRAGQASGSAPGKQATPETERLQSNASVAPDAAPLIAVAGDIACDPANRNFNGGRGANGQCRQMATSTMLLNRTPAAVLALGDTQYVRGSLPAYRASYDPSWGRVKAITRPVPGNHEYDTEGAAGYFDYFGDNAGARGRGWYSFDIGGWHVVALNSNCSVVRCDSKSAQAAWLRQDLTANAAKCTLAFWHHPRFSSGKHGSDTAVRALFTILYNRGVDLLLSGHEHSYERLAPMKPDGTIDYRLGVRQMVVGTGGSNHYGFGTPLRGSQFRNASHYGIVTLRLHPASYEHRFIAIGGRTIDSGSKDCH